MMLTSPKTFYTKNNTPDTFIHNLKHVHKPALIPTKINGPFFGILCFPLPVNLIEFSCVAPSNLVD
jgi:hypothetical protein